jgi:hypothetical protein
MGSSTRYRRRPRSRSHRSVKPGRSRSQGQYHLLWDINGERAYESVYLEDGNTVTEQVWVNRDGAIGLVERIVFGAEDVQRCLEKQQADLTWMQTGERVGPYALALGEPKIIPDQGPDPDRVRDEAPRQWCSPRMFLRHRSPRIWNRRRSIRRWSRPRRA